MLIVVSSLDDENGDVRFFAEPAGHSETRETTTSNDVVERFIYHVRCICGNVSLEERRSGKR